MINYPIKLCCFIFLCLINISAYSAENFMFESCRIAPGDDFELMSSSKNYKKYMNFGQIDTKSIEAWTSGKDILKDEFSDIPHKVLRTKELNGTKLIIFETEGMKSYLNIRYIYFSKDDFSILLTSFNFDDVVYLMGSCLDEPFLNVLK